jgi:hypothetical protein
VPDKDFISIHDNQAWPDGSPLGGRMHLQPNNTERLLGREPHHVREIGVQCHEHAAVLNSDAKDLFVGRS